MDKLRHRNVKYIKGEIVDKQSVNNPRFVSLSELGDDHFEVEMSKRTISMDVPIILGYIIIQYAKLRILQFYYDCVDQYIGRENFQMCEMDTGSPYFALADETLESLVPPELREEFRRHIYGSCDLELVKADFWFQRACCTTHKSFDKRTPGLFKLEASGQEMICLSSKTYVLQHADGTCKFSCKGINKSAVTNPLDTYQSVLDTRQSVSGTNRGFRSRNNTVWTYEQKRNGFGYFYCKRKVLDDGVQTVPLKLVLTPWSNNNCHFFANSGGDHPLSMSF